MSTSTLVIEQHHVVRQRAFAVSGHITSEIVIRVLDALRGEHATGKVSINLSQGSVNSIQFEERAKLS
jgi:hypothetical protein